MKCHMAHKAFPTHGTCNFEPCHPHAPSPEDKAGASTKMSVSWQFKINKKRKLVCGCGLSRAGTYTNVRCKGTGDNVALAGFEPSSKSLQSQIQPRKDIVRDLEGLNCRPAIKEWDGHSVGGQ